MFTHLTRRSFILLPLMLMAPLSAAVAPRPAAVLTRAPRVVSVSGDLKQGWYNDKEVYLYAGTQYTIDGSCDDDCTDLDLKLLNSSGTVVRQDTDPDDVPVIIYTPRYSGTFTVRTIMVTCYIEPCHWRTTVRP